MDLGLGEDFEDLIVAQRRGTRGGDTSRIYAVKVCEDQDVTEKLGQGKVLYNWSRVLYPLGTLDHTSSFWCFRYVTQRNVKLNQPVWFNETSDSKDKEEVKYCADMLYYKQNYAAAVIGYQKLLLDPQISRSSCAELYESMARCNIKLCNYSSAGEYIQKLSEHAKNADQKLSTLLLVADFHRAMGTTATLTKVMQRILLLHPFSHWLWLDFTFTQDPESLEYLICLLRTRLLFRISKSTIGPFVAESHKTGSDKVCQCLSTVKVKYNEEQIQKLDKFIHAEDARERALEQLSEEARLSLLNSSAPEINKLFCDKWFSFKFPTRKELNTDPS